MLPLPQSTKDNYKILFYRLVDLDPDKVSLKNYNYMSICKKNNTLLT